MNTMNQMPYQMPKDRAVNKKDMVFISIVPTFGGGAEDWNQLENINIVIYKYLV